MTNASYPLDPPRLTADFKEFAFHNGLSFDGSDWLLPGEMVYPDNEAFLSAAVSAKSALETAPAIVMSYGLLSTPYGDVVSVGIGLTDDEVDPTIVNVLLSPANPKTRGLLSRLRDQTCVNVVLMDNQTGEVIRVLRQLADPELRETLSMILDATDGSPETSSAVWQKAAEYASERATALTAFGCSTRRPKYARNAPCYCGSGVKYKKCCGK